MTLDKTIDSFFTELTPRVETAREISDELDRQIAYRFNSLKYVRTDELGLSRLIGDLLDPAADHGQGPLFLKRFLEGVGLELILRQFASYRIEVSFESMIKNHRRMDILIEIEDNDQRVFGLAIENKPYAADQENQVKHYLEYLNEHYPDNSSLIYLSGTGHGPSESSISQSELMKYSSNNRFLVMSYAGFEELDSDASIRFEGVHCEYTLAQWFQDCRKECGVEKLRWFLSDAHQFCNQTFGDQQLSNTNESEVVRAFLEKHPHHLGTAYAVYSSWEETAHLIYRRFLKGIVELVRAEIQREIDIPQDDLCVGFSYDPQSPYANWIRVYRLSWHRFENAWKPEISERVEIRLEAQNKQPKNWIIGVRTPQEIARMNDPDKEFTEALKTKLDSELTLSDRKSSHWWPCYSDAHNRFRDWMPLAHEISQELDQEGGGVIQKYFVNNLVTVAKTSIRVIDKLEHIA